MYAKLWSLAMKGNISGKRTTKKIILEEKVAWKFFKVGHNLVNTSDLVSKILAEEDSTPNKQLYLETKG